MNSLGCKDLSAPVGIVEKEIPSMKGPGGPLADYLSEHTLPDDGDDESDQSDDIKDREGGVWDRLHNVLILIPGCSKGGPVPPTAEAWKELVGWWGGLHSVFTKAVVELLHRVMSPLVHCVSRFSPSAARKAAYYRASRDLVAAIDRLDTKIPGGHKGWSQRWLSRPRKGLRGGGWNGVVPGAAEGGFAAVTAAALWCGWRRSPPSWGVLTAEIACGSVMAVHHLSCEAGQREAYLMEARVGELEHAIGPLFRNIAICMRMVRCAQALSFGHRLSVPMPPVSRLETHFLSGDPAALGHESGLALRELRIALADVLEGVIEQTEYARYVVLAVQWPKRKQTVHQCDATPSLKEVEHVSQTKPRLLLTNLASMEAQFRQALRSFMSVVAGNVEDFSAAWKLPGVGWENELRAISESLEHLEGFFRAAGDRINPAIYEQYNVRHHLTLNGRLELAFGHNCYERTLLDLAGENQDLVPAAEALDRLRLRTEEVLVRLFGCQNQVHNAMYDPSLRVRLDWQPVLRDLDLARSLMEVEGMDALWKETRKLVEALSCGDEQRLSTPSGVPTPAGNRGDTGPSEHLDEGMQQRSAKEHKESGPHVFEGGRAEEGGEPEGIGWGKQSMTDVLVAVAAPNDALKGAKSPTADLNPSFDASDESCSELLGELACVLRTRPQPEVCVKALMPGESRLEFVKSDQDMVDSPEEAGVALLPPRLDLANDSNKDFVRELRAQLSIAANDNAFSLESSRTRDDFEGQEVTDDGSKPLMLDSP